MTDHWDGTAWVEGYTPPPQHKTEHRLPLTQRQADLLASLQRDVREAEARLAVAMEVLWAAQDIVIEPEGRAELQVAERVLVYASPNGKA